MGAVCATALVGRVVGLPLGGRVGGFLVIPLSLTPGLCLGVSGPPIGPLWVAPFDGLLDTSLVVGFDAVTRTHSGCHIALAVDCRAIRASCGEGRSFFVGHAGQTVDHWAFCAGSQPIPVRGGHSACPEGRSCSLKALAASCVAIRSVNCRAFCAGRRPISGRGGHLEYCEATPAASTVLRRLLPRPQRSRGISHSHPVVSWRLQPHCFSRVGQDKHAVS